MEQKIKDQFSVNLLHVFVLQDSQLDKTYEPRDLLRACPQRQWTVDLLLSCLKPLQARYYSLSSSPLVVSVKNWCHIRSIG